MNNNFVDCNGVVETVESYEDFRNFMYRNNALALCVDDVINFIWLDEAVHDVKRTDVICDSRGRANMIRLRYSDRSTRWLVNSSQWIKREKMYDIGSQLLVEMDNFFHYLGTGTCITPGSTGHKYQMIVHQNEHYAKSTCVSLSQEMYIRQHSVGGIIMTTRTGEFEVNLMFDGAGHFLAYWSMTPEGAGTWIDANKGAILDNYATYFVECTIDVKETLPMGVFPIRGKKGRIAYPTEKGRYYGVHLWKEQIKFVRLSGCQVFEGAGIGWKVLSSDTWQWANDIYWKRRKAKTETIADFCKLSAVGGIGHHGMSRKFFRLVPDDGNFAGSPVVAFSEDGEPLCYVATETDAMNEAYLLHKQRYCVAMANLASLQFAWEFALEGRLIQIYHDSCLILESGESGDYICKQSNEAFESPPGTWLWTRLTNVVVFPNGDVDSNEYKRIRASSKVH